ncbi:hypothetical protein BDZ89DRAFT_1148530 [Hymenopellis radicata]|nr:hypothetical protein BDZ89DRAFT_1148530 [Hymenopellis radicata]
MNPGQVFVVAPVNIAVRISTASLLKVVRERVDNSMMRVELQELIRLETEQGGQSSNDQEKVRSKAEHTRSGWQASVQRVSEEEPPPGEFESASVHALLPVGRDLAKDRLVILGRNEGRYAPFIPSSSRAYDFFKRLSPASPIPKRLDCMKIWT